MSNTETDTKAWSPKAMYLFALIVLVAGAGATFVMGLGGLILTAVVATWAMLAFLVVMTAGS